MNTTDSIHRQTWDLIPWIINQSASTEDQERARIHLQDCQDCREEFDLQSRIHAGMNKELKDDEARAMSSLQALVHRIDAADENPASASNAVVHARGAAQRRRRLIVGLAAAVVIQAIGLIALGADLIQSGGVAERSGIYSTLSAGEARQSGATIRLVPSPTLSVGSLQRMLNEAGLRVVDSNRGATILALAPISPPASDGAEGAGQQPGRSTEETIALLRGSPDILLVEPILTATRSR